MRERRGSSAIPWARWSRWKPPRAIPDKVSGLGLIAHRGGDAGIGDLLNAAKANDHAAIDMVAIWGNGYRATLGGSLAPGLWMLGGAERLLERARPGVLFADLAACNDYRDALAAAAKVTVPATVILGEPRSDDAGRRAARRSPPPCRMPRVAVLDGAGHMLMSERPDEVLAALRV